MKNCFCVLFWLQGRAAAPPYRSLGRVVRQHISEARIVSTQKQNYFSICPLIDPDGLCSGLGSAKVALGLSSLIPQGTL